MSNFESERIYFEELSVEKDISEEKKVKMGCWEEAWDGDSC